MTDNNIKIIQKISDIKNEIGLLKQSGCKIGFVPTMGNLHKGHISLVKTAKKHCDKVIVSIFINPTQFAEGEDFEKYPKTMEQDCELLKKHGVDIVFAPLVSDIYKANRKTKIQTLGLGDKLCGKTRKGHFDGVAEIVTILLNIVQPDATIFGEKDWQQLCIIKQLSNNINLSGEIISSPTIRESDGLAFSSRNGFLSSGEREIAPKMYKVMMNTSNEISDLYVTKKLTMNGIKHILTNAKQKLIEIGFSKIDYLEICNKNNLENIIEVDLRNNIINFRVFAAAYLSDTRIIDNIPLINKD